MISHDLREPIRHLLLFSRRLENNGGAGLSERAKRDLQMIHSAAERMGSSISGLQTLSEASRKHIRRLRVSVDSCLRAALEDLAESIHDHQAVITSDALPTVEADAALVTLLFRNLVSNAMKYCTREPLIHVTATQDGARHVLGVRDNGIGIDPRYADRIFAPFQRLHGREEYGGGIGLGLAICQKIVAGHGGSIWVDANPEGGTHFRFTLGPAPAHQGNGKQVSRGVQ
jgi:light-regulated signal transduction histidine kinase (bacteriophytochrome)